MPYKIKLTNENRENLIKEIDFQLKKHNFSEVSNIFSESIIFNYSYLGKIFELLNSPKEPMKPELLARLTHEFIEVRNNIELIYSKLKESNLKYVDKIKYNNRSVKFIISIEEFKVDLENQLFYRALLQSLFTTKNISLALEVFDEIMKINPKNKAAYLFVADSLCKENRYSEAIKLFNQAIKIGKSKETYSDIIVNNIDAELHYNLGFAYYKIGDIVNSKKFINSSIKLDPTHPLYYNQLGIIFLEANKFDEAIKMFNKALGINKDLRQAHVNLGSVYIRQEKINEALIELLKALLIEPNHPLVLHNIANVYILKGDQEKALEYLLEAIKHNETSVESYRLVSRILINTDKFEEAIVYLNKYIEINPNNNSDAEYLLGKAYFNVGESEKAIYFLEQAADKGCRLAQYEFGIICLEGKLLKQNIKRAKKLFTKSQSNGNEEAGKMLALILELENKTEIPKIIEPVDSSIEIKAEDKNQSEEIIDKKPITDTDYKKDIQAEIEKICSEGKERAFKKYIQEKSKKELIKKPKTHFSKPTETGLIQGFYKVFHPNNIKSSLLVKIDEKLSDNCEYMDDFKKIANEGRFVGGQGKQGHKFIDKNTLELKILGKNGKGNQRLWGEIIKDKLTGQKSCILSHHGKHIR